MLACLQANTDTLAGILPAMDIRMAESTLDKETDIQDKEDSSGWEQGQLESLVVTVQPLNSLEVPLEDGNAAGQSF